MSVSQILTNIINPSSLVYGAISLTASIGTVVTLIITIRALRESRKLIRLESQNRAMDAALTVVDDYLERVISGDHFGKIALIKASHSGVLLPVSGQNYDSVRLFIDHIIIYYPTFRFLLKRTEDSKIQLEYFNKLNQRVDLAINYLGPLIMRQLKSSQGLNPEDLERLLKNIHDFGDSMSEFKDSLFTDNRD